MSRDKKMLISHSDALLYYVKLNKQAGQGPSFICLKLALSTYGWYY
ncbi:hypothetical protein J7E23_00815 [Pseudomonas sp. ISL-88]|nr:MULTISPECIES: hypothetical protein [Bacteria]MBT2711375.1 hypothetical protein [Pseudomonas sp. ISL-88]